MPGKSLYKQQKKALALHESRIFNQRFACIIIAQSWLVQRGLAHLISTHFPNAQLHCLNTTADIAPLALETPTITLWSPEGIDGVDILNQWLQEGHSLIALGTPGIYVVHNLAAQWLPEWQSNEASLVEAVHHALSQDALKHMDKSARPLTTRALTPSSSKKTKAAALTTRQNQVLERLAYGFTNAEIATQLGMSENTVRIHVSAILRALQLNNRTQAALWAKQQNSAAYAIK